MNERIVEDVLDGDPDEADGPVTYRRVLRAAVFCALAFLAAFVGSVVAGVTVPVVYADPGFEAGHVSGSITVGVAALLLWRSWARIDAVLPDGDDR